MSLKLFLILAFCSGFWACLSQAIPVKQSLPIKLSSLVANWKKTDLISKMDGNRRKGIDLKPKEFAALLKLNAKQATKLIKSFKANQRFMRGEIEQEEVINGVMLGMQMSLLRSLAWEKTEQWQKLREEWGAWFGFAADLAYEEASFVGLKFAALIRALLVEEVERVLKNHKKSFATRANLAWFSQMRFPWPVDRVILSESQRMLDGRESKLVQHLAKEIAKNPYLTTRQVLKMDQEIPSDSKLVLANLWRDADVEALRIDLVRRGEVQIKIALAIHESEMGQADSIKALVSSGLLSQIPINYQTGKPFSLEEIAAH